MSQWFARHSAKAGTVAGWYQQGCGLLGALFAVPLIVRLLPSSEAGLWFAFQSVLVVLQLTDFGFTLVLSRQVAFSTTAREGGGAGVSGDFLDLRPGWEGVSDIYALTCRISWWVGGLGFIALIVLYHGVFRLGRMLEHGGTESATAWCVMSLAALFQVQAKPHQALLDGMARVYLTRVLTGTQYLVSALGVAAVLLAGGRLVSMALVVLGMAALNCLAVRRCVRLAAGARLVPPCRLSGACRSRFLRVAAPLGVLSLSAFLVTSVQVPLVGFLLGTAAVPAYYLAQRIGTVLNQACLQFMFPQLPLFTQQIGAQLYSEAASRLRRSILLVSAAVVAANVVFWAGSPRLVEWQVGPGRYLAGVPLALLAVDCCLAHATTLWGHFVLAAGSNPFVWSTLVSGILNLGLCLVLGKAFGVVGIVVASLSAGLLTNYWYNPLKGWRLLRALERGKEAV